MLLLITGRNGTFVVSRGGKRPLRLFLKRHNLKGRVRTITLQLHLAEVNDSAWSTFRGLPRTTWRETFIHSLNSGRRFEKIPGGSTGDASSGPAEPIERRNQLNAHILQLLNRELGKPGS